MTCYMRHMGWLLDALELESDGENRRRVDAALKHVFGKEGAHCPEVWAAIKEIPEGERIDLVARVSRHMQSA